MRVGLRKREEPAPLLVSGPDLVLALPLLRTYALNFIVPPLRGWGLVAAGARFSERHLGVWRHD